MTSVIMNYILKYTKKHIKFFWRHNKYYKGKESKWRENGIYIGHYLAQHSA